MQTGNPNVFFGNLELLGSYWGQIKEDAPLSIRFPNSAIQIVVQLVEFDKDGEPSASGDVSEDGNILTISVKHAKRMTVGGFGSTEPSSIGKLGGTQAFISYLFHQFGNCVNVNVALYLERDPSGS
ncbi:hypothetical protein ACFLSW_03950 [Candidatus Bipolaricaulota bacterium]